MRLVSVKFDHVKLFKDGIFSFDFFARDRVPSGDESVTRLNGQIYQNNVIALAGVNASGKTTALRIINAALEILKGYAPTGHAAELFDGMTNALIVFWCDAKLYVLKALLETNHHPLSVEDEGEMRFVSEELYRLDGRVTKKDLANASDILERTSPRLVRDRNALGEDQGLLLGDGGSIVRALRDSTYSLFIDAFDHSGEIARGAERPAEFLRLFDPSIEHIELAGKNSFGLRFANSDEELRLSASGVERVLSSGTLKGYAIIMRTLSALKYGAYCLIDEIEVHLNKQLVSVIIDLYASRETNPNGAVLIFSTHYPELLDCVHRKDNVYFLVRDPAHLISVIKYSDRVNRIENKKSEVFLSNYIDGTAPSYTNVRAVRDAAKRLVSA